ncbi:MAG: hypothetical protein KDC03_21555 [Flavobacteriales bacterium]|nr:hypothetical protein [Flavobacteriales bacterium]
MRSYPAQLMLVATMAAATVSQARMPGQPYAYPAPDIEGLLPFTQAESEAFRRAGVREIEIVHHSGSVTRCQLNADGRVTSLTGVEVRNDLDVHLARSIFRYDGEGRLLSRRYADDHLSTLDSLAYDGAGLLAYYLSTRRDRSRKDTPIDTLWHLVAGETGPWLRDRTTDGGCRFEVGPGMRIDRIQCAERTDSVSSEADDQGRKVRRYWCRTDSSLTHLGREEVWKDERPVYETVWEKVGPDTRQVAYRKHFHYDEEGLLRRSDHDDPHKPKELYTYYDNGLVMEQVTVTRLHVRVERYRYTYGP